MKYESMSIKKAVHLIEDKELLLPHIQRKFVWKQDRNNNQVKRFFDTIMRGYPFGTLLFWITKDEIQIRRFIDNYRDNMDIRDTFLKSGEFKNRKKTLVLDGQQRLQALYIALKGTYNNKELYIDILSGRDKFLDGQDELYFNFDYFGRADVYEMNKKIFNGRSGYWVLLKEIVLSDESSTQIKKRILNEMNNIAEVKDETEEIVDENVSNIKNLFTELDLIYFYPIDSTLGKITDYEEILEIFIRTNSGGTILTKSDLMFSLIKLSWSDAEEEFEKLLNSLNQQGTFRFNKDFVLKTALVVTEKKARYEVKKFKGKGGEKTLNSIRNNWEKIRLSFNWLRDILNNARITSDQALPSYNALIPIVYYAYIHNCKPTDPKIKHNIIIWLYKSLLNGNFGGQSDGVIDACTNIIKIKSKKDYFPFFELENEIKNRFNKVVEVNPNIIDGNTNLVLNLAYLFNKDIINFQPLLSGNTPEIDHIFPKSIMLGRKHKKESHLVNNIGNYMFLEKMLNIYKTNKLPEVYFREALQSQPDFFERNFIPKNSRLHRPQNFEKFVEERREIIYDIIKQVMRYHGEIPKEVVAQEESESERVETVAGDELKQWTESEIYQYLDISEQWRVYTYCYFKALALNDGEVEYDNFVNEIKKLSGKEFDGRKFAGVRAGITRNTTSIGKDRLDSVRYDEDEKKWKYSLADKYKEMIRRYYQE